MSWNWMLLRTSGEHPLIPCSLVDYNPPSSMKRAAEHEIDRSDIKRGKPEKGERTNTPTLTSSPLRLLLQDEGDVDVGVGSLVPAPAPPFLNPMSGGRSGNQGEQPPTPVIAAGSLIVVLEDIADDESDNSITACRLGDLALVRAHRRGADAPFGRDHFNAAVQGDHVHILEWLLTAAGGTLAPGAGYLLPSTFSLAARAGARKVMEWLRGHACPWDETTTKAAARHGELSHLIWLVEGGCPCDLSVLIAAAKFGSVENLAWLVARTVPPLALDEKLLDAAAGRGNLEALVWLRGQYGRLDEQMAQAAAWRGHLPVLEWLVSNGCPLDGMTMCMAVMGGRREVVEYLYAQHCPWDGACYLEAARDGNVDLLAWLREHHCPFPDELDESDRWDLGETAIALLRDIDYPEAPEAPAPPPPGV